MKRAIELALMCVPAFASSCGREAPAELPTLAPPLAIAPLPSDLLITLERTTCYGTCPSYVVTIDAKGAVTWNGRDYVDAGGEQRAQVTEDSVRHLVELFDAVAFTTLHDEYWVPATDLPGAFIALRRDGIEKRIYLYGDSLVRRPEGAAIMTSDEDDDPEEVIDFPDPSSTEQQALKRTFLSLSDLATAIDAAANTAQWIGDAPKTRRRR